MTVAVTACTVGYMTAKRNAAEQALVGWAQREQEQDETRDGIVLGALKAGVSKHRIYKLTGIARTTIDRIVAKEAQ